MKRIRKITVTGRVHTPIVLSTPSLYFVGLSNSNVQKAVTIHAKEEKPLRIEVLSFNLADKLRYRVEEVISEKEFRITFHTIPDVSGTYLGAMKIKTNYPKKPILTIHIRGRIKQAPAP
ncbi:MAG: hypothetical protein PVG49_00580 [Desulfobacteraceae bacterium]